VDMRVLMLTLLLATLALAGCGGVTRESPPVAGGPPALEQAENGNFTLYVSNQSFERDSVDIAVVIDGRPAVDGDFAVGNQHNWIEFRFALDDGEHGLRVDSLDGDAILEERFKVKGKRWAVVDYWCCNDASEPKFTFLVSAQPLAFA
jgi:hypothetical protein